MSDMLERAKTLLAGGEQPVNDDDDLVTKAKMVLAKNQVNRELYNTPVGESVSRIRAPDPGILGSAVAGVKKGVSESFGWHPGPTPGVDSAPEKVAETLGYMTGLGIGFVPYSVGTGMVLRGIGFAAPVVNPYLYNFVKNTIAGAAQAGVMTENPEDRGRNMALGALAGGAVEGFLLARAMRIRAPAASLPRPAGEVAGPQLAKELAAAPTEGMVPEKIESTITAMKQPEFKFDQILADMAQTHETTMRIPFVSNTEELLNYAKARLPTTAQVIESIDRILIHNPLDPSDALSQEQVSQWIANDVFDGMQVIYNGKDFAATGFTAGPDRIQLRGIGPKRGLVFTAKRSDVTLPLNPKVFSEKALRQQKLNTLAQAARENIGFVAPSSNPTRLRRGVVSTTDFVEAPSFKDFVNQHSTTMRQMSGLVGDTPEDLIYDYARRRGIPGLVIRDPSGIVSEVRVFDQSKIRFVQEPPRLGITTDNLMVSPAGELRGFTPSWKNAIIPIMRENGIAEKEISSYLDAYAGQMNKRLSDTLDQDFINRMQSAEKQFFEGCL